MKYSPPNSGFARHVATIVFAALALFYAVSGIRNALQAAALPSTSVLRETLLVLLPSIAVMTVLWITHISSLSPNARRVSLAATLIGTSLFATILSFGP